MLLTRLSVPYGVPAFGICFSSRDLLATYILEPPYQAIPTRLAIITLRNYMEMESNTKDKTLEMQEIMQNLVV